MKPLILITNDDGISSPSIKILINELNHAYRIVIVAPKYPQSAKGCSHAHGDVWVAFQKETIDDVDWITVDSTPATCVSVALKHYKLKPDLVISGINFGENLGLNLFYSGTIGAAWEASMSGFLSLAVSLELPPNMHYTMEKTVDFAIPAYFTNLIAKKLLAEKPDCLLWNMNIPTSATKDTEIKEVRIGTQRWNYPIIRETRESEKQSQVRFEYDPTGHEFESNTDVSVIRAGMISLSKIDSFLMPWAKNIFRGCS